MAEPFDVQRWLAGHTPPGFTAVVHPRPLGCWTKLSSTKASGDAAYDYGSLGGLATYQPPSLNQHLGQGYPDLYIRKDDGEATPVEVVIRGMQQCGADPHAISICTFRWGVCPGGIVVMSPGWQKGNVSQSSDQHRLSGS